MHSKSNFGIRKKRIEQEYRKHLSDALVSKVADERLKNEIINITEVEIVDNFKKAKVFFTILNEENKNKVIKTLYSARGYLLNLLREKIKIKYLPDLAFFYDYENQKGNNVLSIIDDFFKDKKGNKKLPEQDSNLRHGG